MIRPLEVYVDVFRLLFDGDNSVIDTELICSAWIAESAKAANRPSVSGFQLVPATPPKGGMGIRVAR